MGGPDQPLRKYFSLKKRDYRRNNVLLCLTQNILLKLRAVPSAKVNICVKGTLAGAILRHLISLILYCLTL